MTNQVKSSRTAFAGLDADGGVSTAVHFDPAFVTGGDLSWVENGVVMHRELTPDEVTYFVKTLGKAASK